MKTDRKAGRWQRGAMLLTLAAVLAAAPLAIDARQGEKNDLLVQEKQLTQGAREWFATTNGQALLAGRRLVEISLGEAVNRALEDNLNLKREKLQERVAEEMVAESAAAFDMFFNASLGSNASRTYSRIEKDMKFKKATTECIGGCNDPDFPTSVNNPMDDAPGTVNDVSDDLYVVYPEGTPVSYVRFDSYRPAGMAPIDVEASKEGRFGPTRSANWMVGLTDPLPWGMSVNVTQSTTLKKSFFTLDGGPDDPTYGSYKRPWASSLTATFNTPVYGSKEFGATAQREVNLGQAGYGRERAGLNTHGRANELVGRVENTYWILVNAVGSLDATTRYRKTVEVLVAKTARMFDTGRVTASSMSQVEAELARAQGEEIQAANGVIQASNSLNQQLNFQDDTLFVPVGYAAALQTVLEITLEEALEKGRKDNSFNRIEEVNLSSSELTLKQRRQQTRPDVNFTASVTASQKSSPFGYKTYAKSMSNLSDPDSVLVAGTLAYRYPVLNLAADANLAQAQSDHSRRMAARTETGKRVDRDIQNAFTSMQSARERLQISTRNLELTETAYAKALSLQEMEEGRRVTEYELLVKSNDTLNARLRYLQALVDIKRNESAMLAAMGALEYKYGGTANAETERQVAVVNGGNRDGGKDR